MKLEVKNMYKEYEGNEILKDVHLQIADGEFVAVMGQSGCGKSTLLYCVSGMDRPTKGEILFGDEPTGALNMSATREVMDILNRINQEGTAILLVTHDAKVAARASRVIYLEDGCVKAELTLGKYAEGDVCHREEMLKMWLGKMGF